MTTVAVLQGGRSLEREVSLRSGAHVQDALERLGFDARTIDVGSDLVERLRQTRPDVAFVALHGHGGEDGVVQELLELLAIPYTGSRVAACARSADKVRAKHELDAAGIPTPDSVGFTADAFDGMGVADALPEIAQRLGLPIVIKPASQGSALGIRFARSTQAVPAALVAAFSYDAKVLLERHVTGRDLAVSLLDGEPLPVLEAVRMADDPYESRYEYGRTRFVCPAELPSGAAQRAQDLAVATWRTMGFEGFARVDLILEEATGELFVLDASSVPGLTETSLLPQAADAAGLAFDDLVGRIVALARARGRVAARA